MALLKYSVLRLALLAVVAVALYAAGLRDLPLIVAAPVLALMLSYVVLTGPRDAAAVELAERKARRSAGGERFSRGIEDDAAAEDATVDGAGPRGLRPQERRSDGEPQGE